MLSDSIRLVANQERLRPFTAFRMAQGLDLPDEVQRPEERPSTEIEIRMLVDDVDACRMDRDIADDVDWKLENGGSFVEKSCLAIVRTPRTEVPRTIVLYGYFEDRYNYISIDVRPSTSIAYHFVLDISSRMKAPLNGTSVFDAAGSHIGETAESYTSGVQIGLRTFGIAGDQDSVCEDLTVLELKRDRANLPELIGRLDDLSPSSSIDAPLMEALRRAGGDFTDLTDDPGGRLTVIAVTAGGHECHEEEGSEEGIGDEVVGQISSLLDQRIDVELVFFGAGTDSLETDPEVTSLLEALVELSDTYALESVPGELSGTLRISAVSAEDARGLAEMWRETVEILGSR